MQISRRSFLQYCTIASASLGLGPAELIKLSQALAESKASSVLWIQGSGCSGCTTSFLNYISPLPPVDAADVLISLNLQYHPTLSGGAGRSVVETINAAENFILIIEGSIPTAFDGHTCISWSDNGQDIPFVQAARTLAAKANQVVAIGTCAAYGGICAMGSNPTQAKGVSEALGIKPINISGCPPHPDWIVGTLLKLFMGETIPLDNEDRPLFIYGQRVCDQCPFHRRGEARSYGVNGLCMEAMNCQGRSTNAPCPTLKWNNGVNWCMAAGSPCLGCTEPTFPSSGPVRGRGRGGQGRGFGRRGA
ncbi:MAG: hydrogenase small subunit [Sedimentisphaerales bacterium]|nr:hydrogenase small subunit [Sedimentisphaerales bacterium]